MGVRNYLIEGVSCSGKTSVCRELQRRGYQAFNGDTDLAYQGDPETGEPADGSSPGHHIWPVGRVEALVANQDEQIPGHLGAEGLEDRGELDTDDPATQHDDPRGYEVQEECLLAGHDPAGDVQTGQ